MAKATVTGGAVNKWSPYTAHVQDDIPDSGSFVDSKTMLFAAGPSRLREAAKSTIEDGAATAAVYPIGVLENVAIAQNRTSQRIWEIGSILEFFIPGRTISQGSMGRSMYNGRSLMRVCYEKTRETAQVRLRPGGMENDEFYINLASDLFNKAFGLLMYMVDNDLKTYGACYLENCNFQGHQFSVNSQSTVIVEGVSFQFGMVVPVTLPETTLGSAGTPVVP